MNTKSIGTHHLNGNWDHIYWKTCGTPSVGKLSIGALSIWPFYVYWDTMYSIGTLCIGICIAIGTL